MQVGQRASSRGVVWYASYTCPHCGARIEEDDGEPTPDDVRQAILADEGTFELYAVSTADPMRFLKVMRDERKLTLEEISELRKQLPLLASGTQVEMTWLESRFAAAELSVVVQGNDR